MQTNDIFHRHRDVVMIGIFDVPVASLDKVAGASAEGRNRSRERAPHPELFGAIVWERGDQFPAFANFEVMQGAHYYYR